MIVTNEIEAGLDDDFEKTVVVKVGSHWNLVSTFELVVEGKSYWFRREEFEKAVRNACNH